MRLARAARAYWPNWLAGGFVCALVAYSYRLVNPIIDPALSFVLGGADLIDHTLPNRLLPITAFVGIALALSSTLGRLWTFLLAALGACLCLALAVSISFAPLKEPEPGFVIAFGEKTTILTMARDWGPAVLAAMTCIVACFFAIFRSAEDPA